MKPVNLQILAPLISGRVSVPTTNSEHEFACSNSDSNFGLISNQVDNYVRFNDICW